MLVCADSGTLRPSKSLGSMVCGMGAACVVAGHHIGRVCCESVGAFMSLLGCVFLSVG